MSEPRTAAGRDLWNLGNPYPDSDEQHAEMIRAIEAEARHPETFCGRCGGPNLATWHAPSPLWNAVMRRNDGPEPFDGIVCPRCFGELAQDAGVADHFCVTTHDAKVPLSSVFGDGRVWDAVKCMWVEAAAALPPSAPATECCDAQERRHVHISATEYARLEQDA